LYKKCEELAGSELSLRSQVTVYAERYQEFQNAIQQSSQMVTSCHTEIEKMGKKIKKLEKERNDFRHRWEIAEQNQRKSNEDVRKKKSSFFFLFLSKIIFILFKMKLMEKEKRQLDIKLDKLDRLCRALQQERSDLQTTIKNLTKSSTNSSSVAPLENDTSNSAIENDEVVSSVTTDTNGSPNLYG